MKKSHLRKILELCTVGKALGVFHGDYGTDKACSFLSSSSDDCTDFCLHSVELFSGRQDEEYLYISEVLLWFLGPLWQQIEFQFVPFSFPLVNVVFYWKLYKNEKSYQSNSFPCQNSVVTSVEKGCWEHQSTEPGESYSYGHLVILYVLGNWQPSSFRRSPSSRWISSCLQHKTEVLSLCHDI